jgi:hypothetical protein
VSYVAVEVDTVASSLRASSAAHVVASLVGPAGDTVKARCERRRRRGERPEAGCKAYKRENTNKKKR